MTHINYCYCAQDAIFIFMTSSRRFISFKVDITYLRFVYGAEHEENVDPIRDHYSGRVTSL